MLFQKRGIAELVAELTGLMNEHGLSEIEYEKNGTRIKVSAAAPASPAITTGTTGAAPAPITKVDAQESPAAAQNFEGALKSPMVGVVYTKPEPSAKDFVSEGSAVKEGDVLCLIEAMKTFNQIKADRSGKIKKIFVKDGETVEFGHPLFMIG